MAVLRSTSATVHRARRRAVVRAVAYTSSYSITVRPACSLMRSTRVETSLDVYASSCSRDRDRSAICTSTTDSAQSGDSFKSRSKAKSLRAMPDRRWHTSTPAMMVLPACRRRSSATAACVASACSSRLRVCLCRPTWLMTTMMLRPFFSTPTRPPLRDW